MYYKCQWFKFLCFFAVWGLLGFSWKIACVVMFFQLLWTFFSIDILHAAAAFADEEGIAQYLSIVKCVGQGSNIFMPGGYYFFDIKQKKGIFVF